MRQDRRILGYLALVVSLVCCLPVALLSGVMAFLSLAMSADPTYRWMPEDLVYSAGAWVFLALSALAGFVLVGFGLWSILSAPQAPPE